MTHIDELEARGTLRRVQLAVGDGEATAMRRRRLAGAKRRVSATRAVA